ncbi:MAG TPA: FlgD immunoglobulin-like domain containing protein [Candidatus Acidoferrales bacterium]|nr:FlgD immunoglobulin-like domain containing protein [Candidatus Acidoferrales bacterium]
MRPVRPLLHAVALATASLLTVSLAHAAWPTDPGVNLPICTAPGPQFEPIVMSDGSGGEFVAWADERSVAQNFYATHVLAGGTLDPAWPVNGLVVGAGSGSQFSGVMAPDGAGGFYLAWGDNRGASEDIYLQRLNSNGTRPTGWPAAGLLVGSTTNTSGATTDFSPQIAADNSGGVYVVWVSLYTAGSDYDIWANRINANAGFVYNSEFLIDNNLGVQNNPVCLVDPSGNLLVAYEDNLNGSSYSMRVRAYSPSNVPMVNALMLSLSSTSFRFATIAPDGSGGAIVACAETTPAAYGVVGSFGANGLRNSPQYFTPALTYAPQFEIIPDGYEGAYYAYDGPVTEMLGRLTSSFTPYAGWPMGGVSLTGAQQSIISDGSGGVIAADLTTNQFPAAVRYNAGGTLAQGWTRPTALSRYTGAEVVLAADGQGGAIATWSDYRNVYGTSGQDIYAQRVDHFGALGNVAPAIVSVKDVPNDQGGHVRVSWTPSPLDVDPTYGIAYYALYQQAPQAAAEVAIRSGAAVGMTPDEAAAARPKQTPDAAPGPRRYVVVPNGTTVDYWQQIDVVEANALTGYSDVTATDGDSTGSGNPLTLFMVEAYGNAGGYWFSLPDSGYSIDNLPPVAPAPFTGTYVPGTGTLLTWGPNSESDLAGYRLYKGSSAGFVPGPGSRIAQITGNTSYTDASQATGWYKLSAYDIHGNESAFTTLLPLGTTGVGGELPKALGFALASPNPVHGALALRLALPQATRARVTLYDAAGRLVRELAQGERPAGEWTIAWDGMDASGHVAPSGLYFARLEVPGRQLTERFVVTR